MSDWTRGDDPVYDGYRESWKAQAEADYEADRAEEEERHDIMAGIPTDRLHELAEAERDGRVVVLPCKVGDLIYDIRGDWETGKRMLIPHRVKSFYVEQKEIGTWEWEMYVSDFAFRVTKNTQMYFTRAEAERALAEKGDAT